MSKDFKKTIIIYLFFVIIIGIAYVHYSKNIYNALTIVKTSKENKGYLNIKIPDKIIIKNTYLGTATISNKSELNKLLKYFNQIESTKIIEEKTLSLDNTFSISGEIYYLNSYKTSFEISNKLKIDNKIFSNDSYLINILRNNLKDAFYTVNNIESLLSKSDNLIINNNSGVQTPLSKESKELLLKSFKTLRIMTDNKDFLKTDLGELPKHHLTVYRYKNQKAISNNTFYIDVYKDYVVIQYLGDENGKNIYLKGNLDEKIFK